MENLARELFEADAELGRAEKFAEDAMKWKNKASRRLKNAKDKLKAEMEYEKAYKYKNWDGEWILIRHYNEYENEVVAYKL